MTPMQQNAHFRGFTFGFQISTDGVAKPLPQAVTDGSADNWVWISLDPAGSGTRNWLEKDAKLDPHVVNAMLASDTRPRCLVSDAGALLILRGVNLDPAARPTDLISIRIWIENDRIITVHHRPLGAISYIQQTYEHNHGPKNPVELVVALAHRMLERMRVVVQEHEIEVDRLEDESHVGHLSKLRSRLNHVRHSIVPLRRYLAPQRDAFVVLRQAKLKWLDDWWRSHLREIADEVGRHIDALDAIRETAHIVQDTLNGRIAERTNSMLVILSIGAAAFLPLNLFVGLLGANVGGIPGGGNPYGFWGVIGVLAALLLAEYAIYRKLRLQRLWK